MWNPIPLWGATPHGLYEKCKVSSMNIVKRIVRKFGVDIVRYSNVSVPSKKRDKKVVINQEKAAAALKSVGRYPVPIFTYYERPVKSSLLMEEAENLWWNVHGNTIEKVWVLSDSVNDFYRKDYVRQASDFFKKDNPKAKILDLGCGSGWFGRMIADNDLEYHGMDFSSTQIEIANQKKEHSSNKAFLNYYCLSDIRKLKKLNEITGVVIHAFLHHLYWEDLNNLFSELSEILPDGCKFFIVEPIYPDPDPVSEKQDFNKNAKFFIKNYRDYRNKLKMELVKEGLYDLETNEQLVEIVNESEDNGFFFSPKEVPFRMTEFKDFLSKFIQVERVFHCGVLNLETAQFVDRIKSEKEKLNYCKLLFPIVNSLDEVLLKNDYFKLNQDDYLFTAFEGILKKKIKQ